MARDPQISPYCSALRSKKLCFAEAPPRTAADIFDGSGRVWCGCTMMSVGPDGGLVEPEDCRAGRACFEPFGAARELPQA